MSSTSNRVTVPDFGAPAAKAGAPEPTASPLPRDPEETLVPASRVRELQDEIDELRRVVSRQAQSLRILEKKGLL